MKGMKNKKNRGFTLIEIVITLVLLGILAAVAVPKYFDLRNEAEKKAMEAYLDTVQTLVTEQFTKSMLEGFNCISATQHAWVVYARAALGQDQSGAINDFPTPGKSCNGCLLVGSPVGGFSALDKDKKYQGSEIAWEQGCNKVNGHCDGTSNGKIRGGTVKLSLMGDSNVYVTRFIAIQGCTANLTN